MEMVPLYGTWWKWYENVGLPASAIRLVIQRRGACSMASLKIEFIYSCGLGSMSLSALETRHARACPWYPS